MIILKDVKEPDDADVQMWSDLWKLKINFPLWRNSHLVHLDAFAQTFDPFQVSQSWELKEKKMEMELAKEMEEKWSEKKTHTAQDESPHTLSHFLSLTLYMWQLDLSLVHTDKTTQ